MFPQGIVQDFSKGGGELNDVHPLNLCSLMGIAIEGPNLIDIPIEESLGEKIDAYPFNYTQLLSCTCVHADINKNFADLKGGGGGGSIIIIMMGSWVQCYVHVCIMTIKSDVKKMVIVYS